MVQVRTRRSILAGALLLGLLLPPAAPAQTLEGTGVVATGLLLRQMDGVKRVLMIGAHPDDENTSILAELARGMGAETAYLSLTRGDGGQNLIGPELWDGLGIIRTGELEAARRLDGGRQFFTRAFDYGYSKRADEALGFWPREELLSDVVWTIRTFRPQVVVSVFTGTPADGHGQHQAAGIMAREAFEAAGDPERFPEHFALGVEPWAPLKLYGGVWRRPSEATVRLETGAYDPLLGRSVLQLSMESRSFHRSQDMGAPRPLGPAEAGMRLEQDRTGQNGDGEDGLFAGIDTTLVGVADHLPPAGAAEARRHLEAYRRSLEEARRSFGGPDPFAVAGPLRDVMARKLGLARRALLAAGGVTLDVRADDDLLTPGQSVRITAYAWNGGPFLLSGAEAALALPGGWRAAAPRVEGLAPDGTLRPGTLATWSYEVTLADEASLSRLYYLREARVGAFYRWPDDPGLWGLPRDPAPVQARFSLRFPAEGAGVPVEREVAWSYVGVNPARGEFRRPVLVVPDVSVAVTPQGMVWPQARAEPRTLTVGLRAEAPGGARGTLRLLAPEGWSASPAEVSFEIAAEGGERSFSFQVRPGDGVAAGEHVFRAEARTEDGERFTEGFSIVDYEHIERAALFAPAEGRVTMVPVRLADGLRVGYVMGTGDDGPEAIRQLGGQVTLLGPDAVRAGDFDAFDVVVVGVRAYETREDLRVANAQLLDWAEAGGTVVVQYQQYDWGQGGYAPYPVEMGRPAPRVAEEDAEVTILEPGAPLFTTPNGITRGDFGGWVQERGLYFLQSWDERYTPLLEMHDQGEEPARGALLVAPVGEGLYVYAALSFFRQWSAGVPGAYRLWANLLSLTGDEWRAFRGGS